MEQNRVHLRLHRRNIVGGTIAALFVVAILVFAGLGLLKGRPANADASCPCNIFGSGAPTYTKHSDGTTYTLGVRLKPDADGSIVGVRFYKDATMTTSHIGSLWGPTGTLLATGTYQNETASGWQSLVFTSPVAVTANTVYTATYTTTGPYIASSSYFTTTPVDNTVLTTLATNQSDGASHTGNGVFAIGSNLYPTSSGNGTNYWADVMYFGQNDTITPVVNTTTPADSATNISISEPITAQFNTALNESSISTSTVRLTDNQGNPVAASIVFNQTSDVLSITPSTQLALNTTYNITLVGGASGIHSLSGPALANDTSWHFTTETSSPCPCSVYNGGAVSNSANVASDVPLTLGVDIKSDIHGFISGVRFYKQMVSTATTHSVALYSSLGTQLATGTTIGETGSGWQTATFASPVAIAPGQVYRLTETVPDGQYMYSSDLTADAGSYPIHLVQNGSYYTYTTNSYPNSKSGAGYNYWIDPVFTETPSYTPSFTMLAAQPITQSYGVDAHKPIMFTFTQALDSSTVAGAVTLKTAAGASVSGATSLNSTTGNLVFTPDSPLAYDTSYTATISSSLKDVFGTSFDGGNYALTFATGAEANTTLNDGKGGPILVVTNNTDKFSTYTAEILRAEGINYFTTADISTLTSSLLSSYTYVLLGSTSLTANQVQTLTAWVNNGGNLVAFKPDKQLAPLLGITDGGSTLSDGYLKVDTTSAPGQGIVSDTMQYHTAADRYSLSGATSVATLYSDATTATLNPAVTMRAVGSGHAAAFTYDLPQSIVMLHQGNPAWANHDPSQIGNNVFRPDNLFRKSGQTDWLNTSKAAIPQADEQQRLLVNMLDSMGASSGPLPHYWYLPYGYKAALEMTSDDHGTNGGTASFLGHISLLGAPGCSTIDWTCPRAGSLVYVSGGPTVTQANTFKNNAFPIGVHVQTNCQTPTVADLQSAFASQIAGFAAAYPNMPAQQFGRIHCYIWEGWADVPKIDLQFGIRYTMEYEWYPSSWVGTNTGALTGSYMTMRFADQDGTMIDVYNAPTDLDYETDPTSATVNADLAAATGSSGFYGIFGTHYDFTNTYQNLLIAAAQQYGVPIISADQARSWKDAQSDSTFDIVSSSNYQVTFKPEVAEGGEGSIAMIPMASSNGALASLTVDGAAAQYSSSTIKGVDYAVFDAAPGTYVTTYGTAPTSPGGGDNSGESGDSGNTGHSGNKGHNDMSSPSSQDVTQTSTTTYSTIFSDSSSSATNSTAGTSPAATDTTPSTSKPTGSQPTDTEMTPSEQQAAKKQVSAHTIPVAMTVGASVAGVAIVAGSGWWFAGLIRRHKGL